MIGPRLKLLVLAWLLACGAVPGRAQTPAQAPDRFSEPPAATAPLRPDEARKLLDWLRDPRQRADFEDKLETLANGADAPPPAAAPAAMPAAGDHAAPPASARTDQAPARPAAPAQPAAGASAPAASTGTPAAKATLEPDSVAAQVMASVSGFLTNLTRQTLETVRAAQSLPSLWDWARHVAEDPDEQQRLIDIGWRLAAILASALAVDAVTVRGLRGVSRGLNRIAPRGHDEPVGETNSEDDAEAGRTEPRRRPSSLTLMRRVPLTLAWVLVSLIPIAASLLVAHILAGTDLGGSVFTQVAIGTAIDAYALARLAMVLAAILFSPSYPRLRLIHVTDDGAAYAMRWIRRIVLVAAIGWAAAEAGRMFGLSRIARDTLLKIAALVAHVMVMIVIVQKRRLVARWIRPREPRGVVGALRLRLAAIWHLIALFYVAALWVVWAVELQGGYTRLLHVFVETTLTMIAARVLVILGIGATDRVLTLPGGPRRQYPGLQDRLRAYQPATHFFVYLVVTFLAAALLLQLYGAGALDFLTGNALGERVLSVLASLALTVTIAILVWEAVNIGLDARVAKLARGAQTARAARIRTLLPMLRTALLVTLLVICGMSILSEIGVNIAPLLAGASVFGIAIGFGSQKLVQDVITGLFLLLENTMQVGDVVSLGGLSGVVENLSIRAIRLRAEDGSVHVIPFSAVTTVTNMTRDYSHAVVEVSVGYRDDYDRVVAVMRDIVGAMRAEPRWRDEIKDDLEVWGLNKFSDMGVTVKCRIRCGPFGRWAVGREFNRRMKTRFEAENLYIVRQGFAEEAPAPPPGTPPAAPATDPTAITAAVVTEKAA